jgi:hypothetical protein
VDAIPTTGAFSDLAGTQPYEAALPAAATVPTVVANSHWHTLLSLKRGLLTWGTRGGGEL